MTYVEFFFVDVCFRYNFKAKIITKLSKDAVMVK